MEGNGRDFIEAGDGTHFMLKKVTVDFKKSCFSKALPHLSTSFVLP